MNHYLLTLKGDRQHMHGYLMCRNPGIVKGVIRWMMNRMDEVGWGFPPIVLMTPLSRDISAVHRIAGKHSRETAKLISQATNFHFSAWTMPDDDPDNKWLMQQH
jgi:hypothetical protein